jgi:ribonuclease HI
VLETDEGTVLAAEGQTIGLATNNVAEYRALVAGLERARDLARGRLRLGAPREADARRVQGQDEALRVLSLEAARLARDIRRVRDSAVRPEHNELADRLVNEALDSANPRL